MGANVLKICETCWEIMHLSCGKNEWTISGKICVTFWAITLYIQAVRLVLSGVTLLLLLLLFTAINFSLGGSSPYISNK